ncbi:hypothetical protein K438DRAFT_1627499, partial [Mycena galopus ATCC 62051]
SNPGVDYYDASAARVLDERLAISFATNSNIPNTPKEASVRTRESAFYLSIFGKPLTDVVPKNSFKYVSGKERLPIAEGWKQPTMPITSETSDPF